MPSIPNVSGLIGLWIIFQIASSVVSSLVMIYVMFCLGKTASSMDRLASAIEKLVEQQPASLPQSRGAGSFAPNPYSTSGYGANLPPTEPGVAPYPTSPGSPPLPFTPGMPSPSPSNPPSTDPNAPTEGTLNPNLSGSNVPYIPRREVMP